MALEPEGINHPMALAMASELRQKLMDMWHPHVYGTPPKQPTPFSIDDILSRPASTDEVARHHEVMSKMIPAEWHHFLTSFALQQQLLASAIHPPRECDLDSSHSSPNNNLEEEREESAHLPQPLNLSSKRSSSMDPYDRQFMEDDSSDGKGTKRKNSRVDSSNESNHELDEDRKKKKVRTTFTGKQIYELERMFESKKYLSSSERTEMSKILNVTEQQVKIWFQNRRTKWKKQENISNAEAAELMKAKNSQKELMMSVKVGSKSSSENQLVADKMSPGPSSSPFLRPSSSASSSASLQMYQDHHHHIQYRHNSSENSSEACPKSPNVEAAASSLDNNNHGDEKNSLSEHLGSL